MDEKVSSGPCAVVVGMREGNGVQAAPPALRWA